MSDASPPPWVRRLRKRDHGVDAGLKVLLVTVWGYGPYNRTGPEEPNEEPKPQRMPAKPVTLWACAKTLAEESGQPLGTVKDQLRRAAAAGWIRRDEGSRMTLAWRAPGCFDYGDRTAGRPSRTVDQPDGEPTTPTGAPTTPDGGPTLPRPVGRPLTSKGTSKELPTNVAERATSPAPSESISPNEVTLGNPGHHPHPEALVPHTREVLDRATGRRPEPEPDTLAQRIAAVSQAASYQLAAGSPKWGPDMAAFQLSTGVSGDELVAMFEHWESAPRPKPPMDKLWWSKGGGRAWLDTHFGLGKAAPAPLTDTSSADNDAIWASAAKAANS